MKYLISISYDGSKYYGLQKLKDKNTVQGELEEVLTKMNESPVYVKCAGRTDRGVHALDQKCHFEITKDTNPYKLRYYINNATSKYLYVKDCKVIEDENFHSRFSVKNKTYVYKINVGEYDPINNDYIYNYNKTIDVDKLKETAKSFLGLHNFEAFTSGKRKSYESIIDGINIKKYNNIIEIEIKGKSFYTYMVRNIVKILLLDNEGKTNKQEISKMLHDGKRIFDYGPVPACGLYLKKIEY